VARECGLFAINERFVTVFDGPAGMAALVMVAAVGVGHITASYDPEVATHARGFAEPSVRRKELAVPLAINRGDEVGIFNLGSTTIAVFEPGRVRLKELLVGSPLRMGTSIGRFVPADVAL
jgi:phosphatidylserine decarboxylase